MHRLILASVLVATALALLASPTSAAVRRRPYIIEPSNTVALTERKKFCAAKWNAMSDADKNATTYTAFEAKCLKGS